MLVELLHPLSAGGPCAAFERADQGGRDRLRLVVGADLAAREVAQPFGHVADGDGHHWEIAGQRLLDHVGRSLLARGEHQRVARIRSEEHTSELQSLAYLVCRLLLEKKKKNKKE